MNITIDKVLLKNIIKTYNPKAIYLVGSSIIVDHPNDIDLVLVYQNTEEARQNKFRRTIYVVSNIKYEVFMTTIEDIAWVMEAYVYENGEYLKFICGEDILDRNEFNIFTNKNFRKKALTKLFNKYFQHKYQNTNGDTYMIKPYRFLMSCYFIYNNDYILTDEQKSILNNVHDTKTMSDELWQFCEDVLYDALGIKRY